MSCGKYREWINLSLDEELPADRAVPLDEHLEECPQCAEYREDLLLGRRMLRATEPEVRDDFEWRLQLRLNQTLAEAAREAVVPWHRQKNSPWTWIRNFGLAGAAGVAAVLLLSLVTWPGGDAGPGLGASDQLLAESAETSVDARDRRPLSSPWTPPTFGTRFVGTNGAWNSANRPVQSGRVGHWSGESLEDLQVITNLSAENRFLKRQLRVLRLQYREMQAQLDTVASVPEHSGGR